MANNVTWPLNGLKLDKKLVTTLGEDKAINYLLGGEGISVGVEVGVRIFQSAPGAIDRVGYWELPGWLIAVGVTADINQKIARSKRTTTILV